uniref:protein acetyllysine N-acetyltransferase n=1 Tax=Eutreptiella gymnastica TaxID=73025 RepID=A0A7S4G2K5_9EUGL
MESNRHSAALSTSAVDDQNLIKGVERLTVDNTPETADAEFERVTPPMSGAAGTKPIRAKAPSGLPTNPVTWHGHLMQPDWDPPILVASSQEEARPGYISCIASEYFDTKATLARKVKVLAHLIRKSKQCCVYTGAGISTTTGVGDYASKAKGSKAPHLAGNGSAGGNRLSAAPAQSHHCLAALERKGHVKHWLQQNHDRLAQKAGFPQAKLNEIHGAWGDDKNPVAPALLHAWPFWLSLSLLPMPVLNSAFPYEVGAPAEKGLNKPNRCPNTDTVALQLPTLQVPSVITTAVRHPYPLPLPTLYASTSAPAHPGNTPQVSSPGFLLRPNRSTLFVMN